MPPKGWRRGPCKKRGSEERIPNGKGCRPCKAIFLRVMEAHESREEVAPQQLNDFADNARQMAVTA